MLPALFSFLLNSVQSTQGNPDASMVVAKGQRFLAEVAVTPQEQQHGLMGRSSMAKDSCMFFLYDEDAPRTIWMKNCLIALDVVWVKENGTIVELQENVPPLSPLFNGPDAKAPQYGGKVLSRHFVEFPAGTIQRLRLKMGDRIGWNLQLNDGRSVVGGAAVPKEKPKTKDKGGKR